MTVPTPPPYHGVPHNYRTPHTGPRPPLRQRLPDLAALLPWQAWVGNPALRSWPVGLFLVLVTMPPVALVVFDRAGDERGAGWTFALYFAMAWFLLLWVVVRPEHIRRPMFVEIMIVALISQVSIAVWLEATLHANTDNLLSSIFAIGVPEELAKILPLVALAALHRRSWTGLVPKDYLFLGMVSGLVFGATEAVAYFTAGAGSPLDLVWRFITDPISHGCWAGVAGYFVGLAVQHRDPLSRSILAGIGLAIPAVLHGLNDWDSVSGGVLWILVTVASALIFLAYATIGITLPASPAPATPASGTSVPVTGPTPPRPAGPNPGGTFTHGSLAGGPTPSAPPTPTPAPAGNSTATYASTPSTTTNSQPAGWSRGPNGQWIRHP